LFTPKFGFTADQSSVKVSQNIFSTGCWSSLHSPTLISPAHNSYLTASSVVFDWSDSTSSCPSATEFTYWYELYSDSGLETLVYSSGELLASQISLPEISDGIYYWRVQVCDNLANCSPWSSVNTLTVDTVIPSSEITDLSGTSSNSTIDVNYQTSEDRDLSYINLCYSWNLRPWICSPDFQDHPQSGTGSFSFTSPQGDGTYYFATIAHDLAGNGESKALSSDPASIITFPSTIVDTKPPTTNLNQSSFSDHWTGQTLTNNSWQIDPASLGDHSFSATTVHLGFSGAPLTENALDAVYQTLSLPANISSHLSFWWRGQSQDTVDFDQFQVQIRRPDDYLLEHILATGNNELANSNTWLSNESGWRWLSHPLLSYTTQPIKIWFGVINRDSEPTARTWVELKDVIVSTLDARLSGTDPVIIDTHDTGTGVGVTTSPSALIIGENNLQIDATDNAGNSEISKVSSLVVLPQVVLNQISFNSSNQFIELYHNGSETVDLTGWYISQVGKTLSLDSTSIAPKSSLKIENTGSPGTTTLFSPQGVADSTTNYLDGIWQRLPNGIGNWGLYSEAISANIGFRLSANRITLTIANIPSNFGANPADRLNYEIKYTRTVEGNPQEQAIAGSISASTVVNNRTDRDFYLGACSSGGACTSDSGLGSNFILSLIGQISSESVNINQTFSP
jgi:hypothetical protein